MSVLDDEGATMMPDMTESEAGGRDKEKRAESQRRYDLSPKRAAQRLDWKARNPEAVRAMHRRYYLKDPERAKAKTRRWRARNPGALERYRKSIRGRSCKFCGLSDAERQFNAADVCVTCRRRQGRNGLCRKCGHPLFKRRLAYTSKKRKPRWGKPYCKTCEASSSEAARIYESMTDAQRKAVLGRHTRILTLWDLLEKTDGAEITSSDMLGMGYTDRSVHSNIWTRTWRMVVSWGLGVKDYDSSREGCKTILRIDRPRLRAFLEPMVQWIIWNGTGAGGRRKGKTRPKGGNE